MKCAVDGYRARMSQDQDGVAASAICSAAILLDLRIPVTDSVKRIISILRKTTAVLGSSTAPTGPFTIFAGGISGGRVTPQPKTRSTQEGRTKSFSRKVSDAMNTRTVLRGLLTLLALSLGQRAHASDDRQQSFTVTPAYETTAPVTVILELRSATETGTTQRLTVTQTAPATITLPVGSHWILTCASNGWWTMPDLINVTEHDPTTPRAVRIWPTGRLHATVGFEGARPKVSSIAVRVTPVPGSRTPLPSFSADCHLKGDVMACDLPVANVDLTFRLPGLVPIYRWNAHVDRERTLDLGRLLFRRGASVSGWIKSEPGAKPGTKVDVRKVHIGIARRATAFADPSIGERLARPIGEAAPGQNGFFQVTGIPKGTYEVRATLDGYAPAVLYPVEVSADAETAIKAPLTLLPPITIHAQITPALRPSGTPWRVEINRISDTLGNAEWPAAFSGTATETGAVEIKGQAPGRFEASVYDDANPIYFGRFSVTSEADATTQLNIQTIKVTGKVHRGDTGVESRLIFGGRFGAVHVATLTQADGEFTTNLPRPGRWNVDVDPVAGTTTRVTIDVAPSSEGAATVDIALLGNRLQGAVLDERDEPVAGAYVSVIVGSTSQIARTGTDGAFVFSSIPVGDARVIASLGERERKRQSNALTVHVAEDTDTRDLRLRLQPATHIVGQVVSPLGPVPGAAISIFATSSLVPFRTDVTSDMDGGFSFEAPDALSSAVALVAPPGLPLRAFEIPLDGRLAVLNLPSLGGTLHLHRPKEYPDGEQMLVALTQDGRLIPTEDLYRWSRNHGSQNSGQRDFTVPSVAAGSYRLCVARATKPMETTCASGVLAPDASLDLTP
jgi:hypothetical protein